MNEQFQNPKNPKDMSPEELDNYVKQHPDDLAAHKMLLQLWAKKLRDENPLTNEQAKVLGSLLNGTPLNNEDANRHTPIVLEERKLAENRANMRNQQSDN